MIQIQSPSQFTKAAERLQRERMGVRRAEPHMYEVTNKTKGTRYHVRFVRRDGATFAACDCPAGLRHGKAPLMCKHIAAAVLVARAIRDARRLAEAEASGARYDGDD
ncbi:MAG TPA: hypothetical protein VF659_24180 [Pyrinomonadaceae bacterium]|jgi:uncharacterized Zn finger protein